MAPGRHHRACPGGPWLPGMDRRDEPGNDERERGQCDTQGTAGASSSFDGAQDEVFCFNSKLKQKQIRAFAKAQAPLLGGGLFSGRRTSETSLNGTLAAPTVTMGWPLEKSTALTMPMAEVVTFTALPDRFVPSMVIV